MTGRNLFEADMLRYNLDGKQLWEDQGLHVQKKYNTGARRATGSGVSLETALARMDEESHRQWVANEFPP